MTGRQSLGWCVFLLVLSTWYAMGQGPVPETSVLPDTQSLCVVDFFYEPGCSECRRIENEVLPELKARLGDLVEVRRWDVSSTEGYERLIRTQQALDIQSNESSLVVIDKRVALAGLDEIRQELIPVVEMCVARGLAGEKTQADTDVPSSGASSTEASVEDLARQQLQGFSLLGIAVAGLADGINPCAIATLVFMISLLSSLRVRGPQLLMTGAAFCVATFLTYFAIGFGLLSVLDSLTTVLVLQVIVEGGMVFILAVLAILSFADAWRYARTGRSEVVRLKLPDRGSRLVRKVIHDQFRRRNLLVGAFVAGIVVTAVESVCTGQVYVPTLVYLVRISEAKGTAMGYLALYNLMFLIPLLVAFFLAYAGLETNRLIRFSQRNVVTAKVLLGLLFIGLGIGIVLV